MTDNVGPRELKVQIEVDEKDGKLMLHMWFHRLIDSSMKYMGWVGINNKGWVINGLSLVEDTYNDFCQDWRLWRKNFDKE